MLEVSLDEFAKITDVRAVREIPSLTEPAERSVRQWKVSQQNLMESLSLQRSLSLFPSFHGTSDRVSRVEQPKASNTSRDSLPSDVRLAGFRHGKQQSTSFGTVRTIRWQRSAEPSTVGLFSLFLNPLVIVLLRCGIFARNGSGLVVSKGKLERHVTRITASVREVCKP